MIAKYDGKSGLILNLCRDQADRFCSSAKTDSFYQNFLETRISPNGFLVYLAYSRDNLNVLKGAYDLEDGSGKIFVPGENLFDGMAWIINLSDRGIERLSDGLFFGVPYKSGRLSILAGGENVKLG